MSAQTALTCDVNLDGAWQSVTLTEAHTKHRTAEKRCPACHGRVIVVGTYGWPPKLNLSHRRGHNGCSPSARKFRAEAWPQPEALA